MWCDRKSLFFQRALPRRAARIYRISLNVELATETDSSVSSVSAIDLKGHIGKALK